MEDKIKVALIGATGSVGSSVIDVLRLFPDRYELTAAAAASSEERLFDIAREFRPKKMYLKRATASAREAARFLGAELIDGNSGLSEIACGDADNVVFASSGTDAIGALSDAIRADKDISLANKESIVAAGPWIMPLVRRCDQIRPVDSEHSAVWQCLRDEPHRRVKRVTLTASGGPFRDTRPVELEDVTPAQALKHPVWAMGAKITIDSATLMNKGIECIEAMRLFDLEPGQIGAVIHPKSLVHAIVSFTDCTSKMLLSSPSMKLPVAAALAWPDRLPIDDATCDLDAPEPWAWGLEFMKPDDVRFPALRIALDAAVAGDAYPPILVGADEVAVDAFLHGEIKFTAIADVVETALANYSGAQPTSADDAVALIAEGRRLAGDALRSRRI